MLILPKDPTVQIYKICFTEALILYLSSIKYVRSDFVILDPLSPVRPNTLLANIPFLPSTSAQIVFFKEDMTEICFANY